MLKFDDNSTIQASISNSQLNVMVINNGSCETLSIDSEGNICTSVSLSTIDSLTSYRSTDYVTIDGQKVYLIEAAWNMPGTSFNGRTLKVPPHYGTIIRKYIDNHGYADMTLREFIARIEGVDLDAAP